MEKTLNEFINSMSIEQKAIWLCSTFVEDFTFEDVSRWKEYLSSEVIS